MNQGQRAEKGDGAVDGSGYDLVPSVVPPPILATFPRPSLLMGTPGRGWLDNWIPFSANISGQVLCLLLKGELPFVVRLGMAVAIAMAPYWAFLRLMPWMRRRRLRATQSWSGHDEPPAEPVLIVGTILPEAPPFAAVGTQRMVVYERTHYLRTRTFTVVSDPWVEIRGVPFRVSGDDGVAVIVNPLDVRLLEPDDWTFTLPEQACRARGMMTFRSRGRKYQQSVLQPGDRVELVGRLERRIAPGGSSAPGRGIPMELTVRPVWKGGIWIRRLPPLPQLPRELPEHPSPATIPPVDPLQNAEVPGR